MASLGPYMQTAHSLGYNHGPGRDMWFEMGWSTKPRYRTALVGNWVENTANKSKVPMTPSEPLAATSKADFPPPKTPTVDRSVFNKTAAKGSGIGPLLLAQPENALLPDVSTYESAYNLKDARTDQPRRYHTMFDKWLPEPIDAQSPHCVWKYPGSLSETLKTKWSQESIEPTVYASSSQMAFSPSALAGHEAQRSPHGRTNKFSRYMKPQVYGNQ